MIKRTAAALVFVGAVSAEMVAIDPESEMAQEEFFEGEDPIYAEFHGKFMAAEAAVNNSLTRTSRFRALADLNKFRRFKAFKNAVMWLQNEKKFGKYCYYGCYCLPALHDSEGALAPKARGTPVDSVDKACKVQTDCYWCVKNAEDQVRPACDETAKYKYELTFDSNDPDNVNLRGITCKDPWADDPKGNKKSHCKRAICECDRGLAYRLRDAQNDWDSNNHKVWSTPGFNDAVCSSSGTANGCSTPGGCSGGPKDQCCGDYTDNGYRYPYSSGGGRACCGSRTYDPTMLDCCGDETLASIGDC